MVHVTTEIIIDKPIEIVADYAINPDNATEWYVNIQSVEWETPRPLTVGSKVAFVAHFLGRKLAYTYEFIKVVPHRELIMRTAEGPFPMETIYTWGAMDEQTTKMILQNKGNPTGFSKLFAPIMATMMRRANKKDLKNLKRILEQK